MHLFTACLGTETNTFSPIPTGRRLFEETYLVRGGAYGENPDLFALPMMVFRDRARQLGWRVTESLCAFAVPAGPTIDRVYATYRDEILADLARAGKVDGVLLSLHGAMVAETIASCETDLVRHIRAAVGPGVPIGVELDLHCHLTEELVATADAIVIFKEYPHVDAAERAGELFSIIAGAVEGRLRPRMAMFDCRMIGLYPTTLEPMAGFVQRMRELEGKDGILSISLAHGFPWGDVPELGTRVVAIGDGDSARALELAVELGRELRGLRARIEPPWTPLDAGLDQAVAANEGPIVLADVSDNAGGGAPSDSTFVLRAMLERQMGRAALGCFWDPGTVALAFEAGEGARLTVRLGGKLGAMSGDPIDLAVRVKSLRRDVHQHYLGGSKARMGDMAALSIEDADEVDVVVNSVRAQTFSPDAFTQLGIEPAAKRYVVVKSMNHFRAGFAPLARHIIYLSAPGAIDVDYTRLPYRRVQRPIYPLDSHAWD
ncbi:MAG: M81 family metallopeptidase [Alphaproteobacteria bacterium]|nr:M81 family metallopeptidase [Alphaproteobacteria bacterium]